MQTMAPQADGPLAVTTAQQLSLVPTMLQMQPFLAPRRRHPRGVARIMLAMRQQEGLLMGMWP